MCVPCGYSDTISNLIFNIVTSVFSSFSVKLHIIEASRQRLLKCVNLDSLSCHSGSLIEGIILLRITNKIYFSFLHLSLLDRCFLVNTTNLHSAKRLVSVIVLGFLYRCARPNKAMWAFYLLGVFACLQVWFVVHPSKCFLNLVVEIYCTVLCWQPIWY